MRIARPLHRVLFAAIMKALEGPTAKPLAGRRAIVTAGLMGTVIPMLSKKAGFDPATTAGPFETAFQDVIGFSVFLWMAQALIRWL